MSVKCLWIDNHVGMLFRVFPIADEWAKWDQCRVEIIHQPKSGLHVKLGRVLGERMIAYERMYLSLVQKIRALKYYVI